MNAARVLRVAATLAALVAVALGLGTYSNSNLIRMHIGFGLLVTLALLITSLMAVCTSGLRRRGAIGVVYALLLPTFGLAHPLILPGAQHWLIEATHLIVSFGAIPFIDTIGTRYLQLKRTTASQAGPLHPGRPEEQHGRDI